MQALATDWAGVKDAIVAALGLPRDALHMGLGLLLFLACAGILRRGSGDLRALALVVAIECANELLDLAHQPSGPLDWVESWRDLLNTACLPTTILLWTHALAASSTRGTAKRRRTPAPRRFARSHQPVIAPRIASRNT